VETGRHDELLARGGAYARLHRSQNNAVTDTGELRMPLWEEPAYGQTPEYEQAPAYGYTPVYHQQYDHTPYPSPAAAPVPTTLPDGRPLFRDELGDELRGEEIRPGAWPGI
jgi:ATP-binding cassette subfamily B protein